MLTQRVELGCVGEYRNDGARDIIISTCTTSSEWNPSNADTNGAEESVLYREVSLFQELKRMQEWYLGQQKVSLLERCPQFRGVLIEGFHCIHLTMQVQTYSADALILRANTPVECTLHRTYVL